MFWKTKNSRKKSASRPPKVWFWRGLQIFLLLVAVDALYLAVSLPNWDKYAAGPIKKSQFIESYEDGRANNKDWPPLNWSPVPFSSMPRHLVRAVVVAEDSRFFSHSGFDTEAWQDAMEHNLTKGRFIYGGSTISQQTAKNMFFSPSRNPMRKWHELVFTYGMERKLSKRRIMEIYLNVAEFGRGIYGVEAAARHYFGKPVSDVSVDEALELAATLPAPVKHNPGSHTRFFLRHKRTIARHYSALQ